LGCSISVGFHGRWISIIALILRNYWYVMQQHQEFQRNRAIEGSLIAIWRFKFGGPHLGFHGRWISVLSWPWNFIPWPWTFVIDWTSRVQTFYKIWAKSDNRRLSYWRF